MVVVYLLPVLIQYSLLLLLEPSAISSFSSLALMAITSLLTFLMVVHSPYLILLSPPLYLTLLFHALNNPFLSLSVRKC